MNKGIFLDRDGTINEDVGDLCDPAKLVFVPRAIGALKTLQKDFHLFIVTNQTGIGKGVFSQAEYERFNTHFSNLLGEAGIDIKEILHCPHTKEAGCRCRKPGVYFIEQLREKYRLDLKASFCIGDHPHDNEMAHKAGTRSVHLLTGHGRKHKEELSVRADYMAQDLYEAAGWIIDQVARSSEYSENCFTGDR